MLSYDNWIVTKPLKIIQKIYRPFFESPLNLAELNETLFCQEDNSYHCKVVYHSNFKKLFPFGNNSYQSLDIYAQSFLKDKLEYYHHESQTWQPLVKDYIDETNFIVLSENLESGKFDLYTIRKVVIDAIITNDNDFDD